MRTLKQLVGDEWRGLSEGLAGDHREAVAKRQAAWAPYGGASRYYLSGVWKTFLVLFLAALLGLATAIVLKALAPSVPSGEAWAIATFGWFPAIGILGGLGRPRGTGDREIGTGAMLKNLFFWTPITVAAYGWFALCAAVLILGGFGLLLFGMRYLGL